MLPLLLLLCMPTSANPFDPRPHPPVRRYLGEANVEQFSMRTTPDCFVHPLGEEGSVMTQGFRGLRHHLGEDWVGTGPDRGRGAPVRAISAGVVLSARDYGEESGWGRVVRMVHRYGEEDWVESVYAHLDRLDVVTGETVTLGQPVGTLGDHLHFEVRSSLNMPLWHGYDERSRGWVEPSGFLARHHGDCGLQP